MSSVPLLVGLDYYQASVQVCVMDRSGKVVTNRNCENDWKAIQATVGPGSHTVRLAIEACSGAANLAEEPVSRLGWSVDLAHPGFVARMKQDPDKHGWTDVALLANGTDHATVYLYRNKRNSQEPFHKQPSAKFLVPDTAVNRDGPTVADFSGDGVADFLSTLEMLNRSV